MDLISKLRLQQVKRFPICYVNREQSVAEHSYNVLLIAMDLAKETDDPEIVQDVVEYAMLHDIEEVYTGDIPSSFKRQLRAECPSVSPLLEGAGHGASDEVKAIVKLADYLEAMYYIREFGGSRLAQTVLDDISMNFNAALRTSKARPSVIAKARNIWGWM